MHTQFEITPEQATLLTDALQSQRQADMVTNAVFAAIVRGHRITNGNLVSLAGTTLVVSTEPAQDEPVV